MKKKDKTNNWSKKLLNNRYIKGYLIPLLLLIISFLFAGFTSLSMESSFTILPANHYSDASISPQSTRLFKDGKITGKFVAKENNLGVISLPLKNYNDGNKVGYKGFVKEDTIVFRIKEAGAKKWYYDQEYSGGQFHELNFFPFGFPTIDNSQNKTYVFEVVSKAGNYDNVLTLRSSSPVLKTNYKFDKSFFVHNPNELLEFLLKKQQYAFTIRDYYFILLIYLVPFILYMTWLSPLKHFISVPSNIVYRKFLQNKYVSRLLKYIYGLIIFLAVFVDIFFITIPNPITLPLLVILWTTKLFLQKNKSSSSFSIAFIILLIGGICIVFQQELKAEKAAVWFFYFALIGTIHSFIESKVFRK